MITIEAVNGVRLEEMEMWEAECNHTIAKERDAQRIMATCPVCEHCGGTIDLYGVYGAKYFYEYGGSYYHKKCFPEWLYKHPGDAVDIAMELANDEYLKPIKEWRD